MAVMYRAEKFRHWLLSQWWFSSVLLPAIPRRARWELRRLYFAPLDFLDRISGRRDDMVPPRSQNFTGAVSGLEESAEAYVAVLVARAGLTPSSRVLDIGSGMGRLATGLIPYLDQNGSYDGLDIVPAGIEWCNKHITAKHPNFRFTLAEVYNAEYNPKGKIKADQYKLPYPDESFDIVTLVSVFTHMLPAEVDNYLGEIRRVLKPGGRCYASYLLLTDQSRPLMSSKDSIFDFRHNMGTYYIVDKKVPELAVGYEESFINNLYIKHQFRCQFYPGDWWKPRQSEVAQQDVIVATR